MGLRGRSRLKEYHCYFVTCTCHNFLRLLEPDEVKDILIENLNHYNRIYSCRTVAYVIMPEHFHMICYFEEESRLSDYMRDLKKFTSFRIRRYYAAKDPSLLERLQFARGEQKFKVWMDRFDDLYLFSRKVILIKLNYIHRNPVKRGLCEHGKDYRYSSCSYYTDDKEGVLPVLHVENLL